MNNKELKQKALDYIKEKNWDTLLVDVYLTTSAFYAWKDRKDFESDYNIGLSNIHSTKRKLSFRYHNEEVSFLCAMFHDKSHEETIPFEIGGDKEFSTGPDGDSWTTAYIELWIDGAIKIAAHYSVRNSYVDFVEDFSIFDCEEFHDDKRIQRLLSGLVAEKKKRDERKERTKRESDEKHLEGKFTFDDD